MEPERSWQAGLPRTTPKGDQLEGVYRETYWTSGNIARGEWPDKELNIELNVLVDRFSAHRDFLRRIRLTGGKSEFFVGWFFEGNGGDVLDSRMLGRMAGIEIDLALDIYSPDPPQNEI